MRKLAEKSLNASPACGRGWPEGPGEGEAERLTLQNGQMARCSQAAKTLICRFATSSPALREKRL
jgi:hypothetical protein